MKTRREVLLSVPALLALVGCNAAKVEVKLPVEVLQFISDANLIVQKGQRLLSSPTTSKLFSEAQTYIEELRGGRIDSKRVVGALGEVLGVIAPMLPAPYNAAALVLVGLMKAYGRAEAAPSASMGLLPAMSPAEARAVLERLE